MGFSHGREWTEKSIQDALLEIVNFYNMKTFPTHSEMEKFTSSKALSNAVSKHGGTRYFARKMNLPIKKCESEFGNDYELLAMKSIKEMCGFDSVQTKPRYPYDVLVNGNIKVDVKVSKAIICKNKGYEKEYITNTFNLEKREPTCDIFILYCLDLNNEISKTLIIPSAVVSGLTQVGVGLESHWDCFNNQWGYFDEYDSFYKKISNMN